MKKYAFVLMIGGLILFTANRGVFAAGGDMGGSTQNGSAEYPYLIEDFNDFQEFCGSSSYWASGVYTQLDCDLDLDPNLPGRIIHHIAPIAGDTKDFPSREFDGKKYAGYFDGNDHTIGNMIIDGNDFCGLFGWVDSTAIIENFRLQTASINGNCFVAPLAGCNTGYINNCYSKNSIVDGYYYVSSLIGANGNYHNSIGGASITNSYSTGIVKASSYAGGLAGRNYESNIINCHSNCQIYSGNYTGGFVGNNASGSIIGSYSKGQVNAGNYVGGLVGYNGFGFITKCYSTVTVTSNDMIGGLLGNNNGTITSSFWDIETSGIPDPEAGLPDTDGMVGKTTSEMKTQSTFTNASWDFVNSWGIGERQTYPYLRKYSAADISCDGMVNFVDFAVIADNWLGGM